ncbi:hypothetical protein CDV36_009440 [Fusarium kuroshium]|uniref:Major facilitator superfamily (MFS) profile domain-containing protein n=1 Tax=Fusarium kuroshium TaxID=2010991 RepID=A0A3M2S0S7_9HYPO|nr:hypothetical protein CDV36_009440 [Fusarium kuroshium]
MTSSSEPTKKTENSSSPDVEIGTFSQTIDMVPGTRLLLNPGRDDDGSAQIVLSPKPSSDPDDPLNWSTARKTLSFLVVNIYSFMVAVVALSTAVTYGALIAEFDTTAEYLNALRYGRRPVYMLSCLLTGVAQVIAATAQRSSVFIGSRILMGFVAAPFEQRPAVTVNDQFFVHQRGFGLSLYVLAATLGSFIGPLATGFIVDGVGWRWVYWTFAITMGVVTILAFFFLEEIGYNRNDGTFGDSGPPLHEPKTYVKKLKLSPLYGYNFSFTAVGLTSLSPLVGSMILFYAGGAGTDRFMIWRARRNGGIMEPESRIYAALVAGPIMSAGLVLYGAGASAGFHWMVPVVGMGFIGTGVPIAGEVSLGYVTECYSHRAGEASTAMITVRNIIACVA